MIDDQIKLLQTGKINIMIPYTLSRLLPTLVQFDAQYCNAIR